MSGLIHYGALKIEKIDKKTREEQALPNESNENKKAREERNSKIEQQDMPYHINIDGYLSKIDSTDSYKNRVKTYLQKLDSSVSNVMNKFYTDPVISKCIHGRDMRQITGKAQGVKQRNFSSTRFPNLLDSVSSRIMLNAINVAQIAYSKSYEKEFKKFSADKSEEDKKAMCYGMTSSKDNWECVRNVDFFVWSTDTWDNLCVEYGYTPSLRFSTRSMKDGNKENYTHVKYTSDEINNYYKKANESKTLNIGDNFKRHHYRSNGKSHASTVQIDTSYSNGKCTITQKAICYMDSYSEECNAIKKGNPETSKTIEL